MNKIGVIKTKLLKKLTESYGSSNKSEMKNILKTIVENKEFKEMYLFYEEIENKYFEDKETAKLYVEGIDTMLNHSMAKQQVKNLNTFCESLDKKLGNIEVNSNELYEALDQLGVEDSLSNLEKKIVAKKKLIEHLTKKKSVEKIVESKVYTANENLLHAVLVNNFNNLYENTLTQEDKEQLKNILELNGEDLVVKTKELKETILNKVENILSESKDGDLGNKLQSVKNEVNTMELSKYNYYRLTQLKNGLD
jgi:hypothetical protein